MKYKENRALSKLKDIDFISFKLFRLLRTIQSDNYETYSARQTLNQSHISMQTDEDDQKSPEQYARTIQMQFNKISHTNHLKQIEFFVFGCLSALKNNHFPEAFGFINQAPLICNFGEQIDSIETIIYFELLKMVEAKLMTKIGRPEQGILLLMGHYYENKVI